MSSTLAPPANHGNNSGNGTATEESETDVISSQMKEVLLPNEPLHSPEVELDSPAPSNTCLQSDSKTSKGIFKNLPDIAGPDWYSNKCFSRYWNHYKYVMNWYVKHRDIHQSLQRRSRPYPSFPQPTFSYSHPALYQVPYHRYAAGPPPPRGRGRASKRGKRKVPHGQHSQSPGKRHQSGTGEEAGRSPPESMQMDISEEMLDFFAKSHEHKKQREAEKKAEMQKLNEDKRINIEEVKGQPREITTDAPKERPGSRRTSEMKVLYGRGAAMIHGMETALQMAYDRSFDAKQPKYWPNMPLRCVFQDI